MKTLLLRLLVLLLPILLVAAVFFPPFLGSSAQRAQDGQQDPPNYDAFASSSKSSGARVQNQGQPQIEAGRAVQTEPRLGVPTFLWASDVGPVKQLPGQATERRTTIEATAREHLGRYATHYRLKSADVAEARLVEIHDPGMGAIIARFRQSVGGVEVFRDEVKVMMNRQLQLVAISGYITGTESTVVTTAFNLPAQKAIAIAMQDLTGTPVDESAFEKRAKATGDRDTAPAANQDPYSFYDADSKARLQFRVTDPARVKQVMFHLPDQYVPAYYIESHVELPSDDGPVVSLNGSRGVISRDYSYVISAVDGQLLFRKNLVADQGKARAGKSSVTATSYTYRVWADPTTKIPQDGPQGNGATPKTNPAPDFFQAPFVAPSDVSLISGPISTGDPWLPDGATETNGNNADAFLDIATPDGFNGADFRGMITAPGQFLHTYDTTQQPTSTEQRLGAIQQLFYMNNFLHDWYYDAGFNEAAGNAQTSNYGRGGLENDNIKAQGQDFASRNNANMLTPADGGRPRMRMYVFDANVLKYVNVVSPANIAGKLANVGTGQFGQQVFNVTNAVVQPNPAAGCTAASFTGTAGKFVLVDRQPTTGAGSCSIGTKLNNAMAAGAAGFILVNLSTTPDTAVNVTGSLPTFTIPFLSITWNEALGMKSELAVPNVVTATMRRDAPGVDRDGTIDNQVIAHEWGHYLSNRLIGDANGINNNQAGGMGEGWGDTSSMILSVRADDINVPSNANWAGVYAMAGYVTSGGEENNGYYNGIRRYPYSTDLMKNPLTFKHIQNGNALPVGPPVAFGADGSNNAEVHNTGEVWAVMLWECYAALLRDTLGGSPRLTFQQAQDRMRLYLVTSLKMTPVSPTFTEARDAVLAAAGANDPVDYSRFLQAFAKRGIGIGAVSPDRFDGNNATVVESFVSGKDLQFLGATLNDSPASCDHDGVLDNGETGTLTVTLHNTGDGNLGPINATITSSSPGVTVLNGGNLTFPASVPYGQTTATINVKLNGAANTIQQLNFTLSYGDPTLIAPTTRTQVLSFRANTNILLANMTTDDVESPNVKWTTGHGATGATGLVSVAPFVRREVSGIQHEFFGTDASVGTDEYLISPVFTVNGSGSFNLQFDHSWGFEFDGGGNYDGGVVEMSVNGGAYADIGTTAYNGTILNYSGDVNPLKGRQGFVQNSAGTVHTSLTQAVAPGSTVRIRFRIGTDNSFGAAGWHIDNIAFTGVVETPFDTVIADSGCVIVCPTITLSPATLPSATVNTAYNQTITASPSGPTYNFSVTSGALPAGLALNSNGSFSGAPTQSGVFNFRVTATDLAGCTGFRDYTLVVICQTISVTPASLPGGTVGTAYSQTVSATPAGTYSYTVTAGSLPAGLTLNASTGAITGTPTTPGSSTFTITAAAGGCAGSLSYTVAIACPTLSISPGSLPGGNVGVAYSQTLSVTPAGTYSFSVLTGTLPSGLNLNASTGVISGTPAAAGTATFTIKALAANGCSATQNYTLAITCPTVSISPATLPNGTTGTAYSQTISATPAGGNYVYAVTSGSLPGGLSLNSSTGVLSGTPTTNGTFNFSITATGFGSCASAPQSYSITIGGGGCPTITLPNIASTGSIGVPYSQSVAASPSGSYTYGLTGTTPPGVTFYNAAALLYGYPTTNGTYTFTITATDSNNCTGSKIYTITIGGAFARAVVNDFDGDGKSDLVVWRGKQSQWEIAGSGDSKQQIVQLSEAFDPSNDVMACGDYDGDGKYDLAFYHRATGQWLIRLSKDGSAITEQWGIAGDVPVSADYDGDGKADLAVWRESESTWYIKRSSDGQMQTELFGASGLLFRDVPVPADYDGDGKTDLAVFRQGIRQAGHWYIKQSSDGVVIEKEWGLSRDVPVVADYDGDGKADIAVWRSSDNNWYILQSSRSSDTAAQVVNWGISSLGDVPVAGDYDGDGKADVAVWRASSGVWYVRNTHDSSPMEQSLGQSGDTPRR